MNKFLFISTLILVGFSHANAKQPYHNKSYQVPVYQGKLAPIQWDKKWQSHQNMFDHYTDNSKELTFAGAYAVTWRLDCDNGDHCPVGAMVDKRTGKIYDFPMPHNDCEGDEVDDKAFFADSRLLMLRHCQAQPTNKPYTVKWVITKEYKLWNESKKRFTTLKKATETQLLEQPH